MTFKLHPYCEIFPDIMGPEFDELVADIKANGQREPIELYGGKIIDGKNRERACIAAGIAPHTRNWQPRSNDLKGADRELLTYVISKNLHRRQMDASQRAMVAAKLVTTNGPGGDHSANLPNAISQENAAKALNVSTRSVTSASRVIEQGSKELCKAVESGEVSVNDAASVATLPKAEQKAAVKKVRDKKAPTLKKAAEPQTADAVRRNGQLTVKGREIDEESVTKAFGAVVRLIDKQATDCDMAATAGHRAATDKLGAALEAYKQFTTECRRAIARK